MPRRKPRVLPGAPLAAMLMLTACGTPAVLRGAPDAASMATPSALPVLAIAQPTGEPPITLGDAAEATPPAMPRSDPGGMP